VPASSSTSPQPCPEHTTPAQQHDRPMIKSCSSSCRCCRSRGGGHLRLRACCCPGHCTAYRRLQHVMRQVHPWQPAICQMIVSHVGPLGPQCLCTPQWLVMRRVCPRGHQLCGGPVQHASASPVPAVSTAHTCCNPALPLPLVCCLFS
jgi:hypothetical protein